MLVMKDCGIEPGDILLVVSNSQKAVVKLKQFAQALTTPRSKHGHMEVISVFVCTGKNKYGVICHNFERQLTLSTDTFIKTLEKQSIEELTLSLFNYCNKDFSLQQMKQILEGEASAKWMRDLVTSMKEDESRDEFIEHFLLATKGNKVKLIQSLLRFWQASQHSEILPAVSSSLLVFKHTEPEIRQRFLDAFIDEVKVTERLFAEGKKRASSWALFKSYFSSAKQDKKDREKLTPSTATFCSSNLMQVFNQVDPDLVNRGRHVLPKALEAGMREATKIKIKAATRKLALDDFEALIAEQEELLPPFRMVILPAAGTELMSTLISVIDDEIDRIQHKFWRNAADKQKAADLKKLLLPYRHLKFQSYPINLQVGVALELIASLLPTLQTKTGLFGKWISSTSYTHVRAFARTQGIFDGDIREVTEKLKNNPPKKIAREKTYTHERVIKNINKEVSCEIYILSDWSLSSWSPSKRKFMLEHMSGLLTLGHALYAWENERLVRMTKASLQKAINGEDFDDLLTSKLKPATRTALMNQAKQQLIETSQIKFLDYQACKELANEHESTEDILNQVAPLFALKIDEYHLNQAKQNIIDIELENTQGNDEQQSELRKIKEVIIKQKNLHQKTYQSGIDTKASVSQPQATKKIFKPLNKMLPTPSSKYYRNEIYTDVVINENPSSPFQYFDLLGMNATEKLVETHCKFHSHALTNEIINKRKTELTSVLFKGKINLTLTTDWQALPSLDPCETLLDVAIDGLKTNDLEIKYSAENHLYYLRLVRETKETKDVSVYLLLQMPKHYRANPIFNTLQPNSKNSEIHQLLMKYLKFGKDDGSLRDSIGVTVHNGREYLSEANKLGIASCRLKAIAFKVEMKRLHPEIPVSVVVNKAHCFIEMELEGTWRRYCLGGYSDTPNLLEKMHENTLETCRRRSQAHCFFTKTAKPQPQENTRFAIRQSF